MYNIIENFDFKVIYFLKMCTILSAIGKKWWFPPKCRFCKKLLLYEWNSRQFFLQNPYKIQTSTYVCSFEPNLQNIFWTGSNLAAVISWGTSLMGHWILFMQRNVEKNPYITKSAFRTYRLYDCEVQSLILQINFLI